MFKKNTIIYFLFIHILFISNVKTLTDYNRHENEYIFDCLGDNKGIEDAGGKEIETAEDCFDKSPRRKWKCCFFQFKINNVSFQNGCMKVKKNNITDLNDLKYFVSKLSTETVFNCRQNYIAYSFIISLSLLLFLI